MKKETVLSTEHATLYYYPEQKIVHHVFHKFIYGDYFRNFMTKAADIFEEKGCKKWLSDDREQSALHPEDKKWGDEHWNPRMKQAGWKYWALILPKKAIGQINIRRLIKEFSEMGVTVQIFSEPDEGLQWLASQE